MPDSPERGGASVEPHNHQRYMDACLVNDDELTRTADVVVAKQQEIVSLRAELAQARADTDDLVAKAWDAAKAGIDQLTQERDQARAERDELRQAWIDSRECAAEYKAQNQALRDAMEKHHWPDLVPGDGPCETCGLKAEAWYGIAALDGQAQPRDEGTSSS